MKKLIVTGLIAIFALGCSPTNTESDYETELQLIDKKDVEIPSNKKLKKDKDE